MQFLYVITPFLFSLVLITPYANPFTGFITRVGQPGVLIPFNQEAILRGYSLFSAEHLSDFCTHCILLAFGGVVLCAVWLFCAPRRFVRCLSNPRMMFLGF